MNQEVTKSVSISPVPVTESVVTLKQKSLNNIWVWWFVLCLSGSFLSFFVIGIPLIVAAAVLGFVMLYKWWTVIQDGNARTTPGAAVGFCFVPFYNFYWYYVVWVGLVKDMNSYCRERNIPIQLSEGTAITYYIFLLITVLTAWIPFAIFITIIPTFIIGAILFKSITNAAIKILKSN